jgi:hypothetical protein
MRKQKQSSPSARLNLPRDLQAMYCIGRMGAVMTASIWRLFYGSPHTARRGMARLQHLGLLRTFPRAAPSFPCWYSATPRGMLWVTNETGCPTSELRAIKTLRRINLSALATRNDFWASLILATRDESTVALHLFLTEAELRRLWASGVPIVPDALVILRHQAKEDVIAPWFIEFDSGTERLTTWREKVRAYVALHDGRLVYGVTGWEVLVLVPSIRRARNIALIARDAGAGAFIYLAVEPSLRNGAALNQLLWKAEQLAQDPPTEPRHALGSSIHGAHSAR